MIESRPERAIHLALLAYQTGLIDPTRLRDVLDTWDTDRSKDVADLLVERGSLSQEARTLLDALARHQAEDLGGVAQALATLAANAGASTVEEVATRLPDLASSLGTQAPSDPFATQLPASHEPTQVGTTSASGQRYRSIRFHARGGLGAVFVAMDEELKRKVALKEIQGHRAHQQADRERFVVEAEITGKLEHPGIVPVYGLGTYADGRPFYAMRFIQGDSLETACRAFHADPDPSARSVALRGLLRRFLDVCNAVEYAHSRGVLHRDLKPGNIMVGKYGETLVVDWGLARVMGQTVPGEDDDHHGPIDPSTLSGSAQTIHGHAVGTPGFMSPEQAAGLHNELGQASDVYSLGATLYFVLTGRGPFSGSSSLAEIYEKARLGDFPPPRTLNPDVPRALDAICRKAMSVAPDDRYPTPRALADELEHFLADEPVDALPDTGLDRVLRWARRHRQATVSAALALVSVTVVAVAASFLVDAARRSEQREAENTRKALKVAEDAKNDANRAQAEAEANFQKARKAVDDFLTAVSQSQELQLLPDTQAFRRRLLEKARSYYQDFLKEHAADDGLRRESGDAARRLAGVVWDIGSGEEALSLYNEALRLIEPLASANPGNPADQDRLADALNGLANVQSDLGRNADAERGYRRALAIHETLAREHPEVASYQEGLALELGNLAQLRWDEGELAEAEGHLGRGIAIREALVRGHPENPAYREGLARKLADLANLQGESGRNAEAGRTHLRALGVYESLARDHPRVAEYRANLAITLGNFARFQYTTGNAAEAVLNQERGIAINQAVVRDNPRVTSYQVSLANMNGDFATLMYLTGRKDKAGDAYARAVDVYDSIVRENPKVVEYRNGLARTLGNQAQLQEEVGQAAEAERTYARALAIREALVREQPGVPDLRELLARTRGNLANLLARTGRAGEAEASFQQAIQALDILTREHPKVIGYRVALGRLRVDLGDLLARVGRREAAIAAYRQGAAPLAAALATEPRHPVYRNWMNHVLLRLARELRSARRPNEAMEITRTRAKLHPGDPGELYNVACELSGCLTLLSPPDSDRCATEAIGTLRSAIAAGWSQPDHTAHDPDLAPLRHRSDFQALLRGLQDKAFPADPFVK